MNTIKTFATFAVATLFVLAACGEDKKKVYPEPEILRFVVQESGEVSLGDPVHLFWQTREADTLTLTRTSIATDGTKTEEELVAADGFDAVEGEWADFPTENSLYVAVATGNGGRTEKNIAVGVVNNMVIIPPATPTPSPDETGEPQPTPTVSEEPDTTATPTSPQMFTPEPSERPTASPTARPTPPATPRPECTHISGGVVLLIKVHHADYVWRALRRHLRLRNGAVTYDTSHIGDADAASGIVRDCNDPDLWSPNHNGPTTICADITRGVVELEWNADLLGIPGYGSVPQDVAFEAKVYRRAAVGDGRPTGVSASWESDPFTASAGEEQRSIHLGEMFRSDWCPEVAGE